MDSYLVNMVDVPELLNYLYWTNQSLCWQCGTKHCCITQQVLTTGDVVTDNTLWNAMFQVVSVVNDIYCNATVGSMGQENTLITVSHKEHNFCLSLFLPTFIWSWYSLVMPITWLSLQLRLIQKSPSHPLSVYSKARLHLHIYNEPNAVWWFPRCRMYICQVVWHKMYTDFPHFQVLH
jgi:hypothetical protein